MSQHGYFTSTAILQNCVVFVMECVPSLNKAGTFVLMNGETFFEVDFFTQILDISVIFK